MGYFIEDGKSLSCKKGILGPHDEVKAEYISAVDSKSANAQIELLTKNRVLYKADKSKPDADKTNTKADK